MSFNNLISVITLPVCPLNVNIKDPVIGFHIRTVLSDDPEAKLSFINENNEFIPSVCASSVNIKGHVFVSNIFIVLSL